MDRYAIIIYWSDEDQVYIAEVPELPGCITHGETQSSALVNANEAIQLWVDTAKEFGNPIPDPKGHRQSADLIEPKTKRLAVNALERVGDSVTNARRKSSARRNKPRIFSSLRAPQSTTNPKAH